MTTAIYIILVIGWAVFGFIGIRCLNENIQLSRENRQLHGHCANLEKRLEHMPRVPYSWIQSSKRLPKTERKVLLFYDEDLPDPNDDCSWDRYEVVHFISDWNNTGNPVFHSQDPYGKIYTPSPNIWWQDFTQPAKAKHIEDDRRKQ